MSERAVTEFEAATEDRAAVLACTAYHWPTAASPIPKHRTAA